MKNFILIALAITFLASCAPKNGSLEGSISYDEKEPDVGASIELYSLLNDGQDYKATADVSGKYLIPDIPPGEYLIAVRSRNTISCPQEFISEILKNNKALEQVFGTKVEQDVQKQYNESLERYNSENAAYVTYVTSNETGESIKLYDQQKGAHDELVKQADQIVELLPDEFKKRFDIKNAYPDKLGFKVIEIKPEEKEQFNVHFGESCF